MSSERSRSGTGAVTAPRIVLLARIEGRGVRRVDRCNRGRGSFGIQQPRAGVAPHRVPRRGRGPPPPMKPTGVNSFATTWCHNTDARCLSSRSPRTASAELSCVAGTEPHRDGRASLADRAAARGGDGDRAADSRVCGIDGGGLRSRRREGRALRTAAVCHRAGADGHGGHAAGALSTASGRGPRMVVLLGLFAARGRAAAPHASRAAGHGCARPPAARRG